MGFSASTDGVLDGATWRAPSLSARARHHRQRRSRRRDAESLSTDSWELDFRALLRVLRERVADATGVIEDGSALGHRGTVLGRRLDCREMLRTDRLPPLPGGAPDLISPLTEQAAHTLGWNDPQSAAAFFRRGGPTATAISVFGCRSTCARLSRPGHAARRRDRHRRPASRAASHRATGPGPRRRARSLADDERRLAAREDRGRDRGDGVQTFRDGRLRLARPDHARRPGFRRTPRPTRSWCGRRRVASG